MLNKTTELCRIGIGRFINDLVDRTSEKVNNQPIQSTHSMYILYHFLLIFY